MNKKIIWTIILLIGLIIALTIINSIKNNDNEVEETFKATVLENMGNSLLVEPLEGEDELNSSDKISLTVPVNDATLKDLSEFSPGSIVEITYNGEIMESYPAQIRAIDVKFVN